MNKSETTQQASPGDFRADAETATAWEHELTPRQAVKVYSRAIGWSILLSTAIVMEGYDGKLISSSFAQPAFVKSYGVQQPDGSYEIAAGWQSGLNNASNVAQMMGLLLGGWISERIGFRKTMLLGLFIIPFPIFAYFFAPNLEILLVGQILFGKYNFSFRSFYF